MQQNDDDFLRAMGLNPDKLSDEQKQKSLEDILYTLNVNVGNRVIENFNEEQLKEFDELMSEDKDANDQEISDWLANNVPNYAQLIEEEAQKMKKQHDEMVRKVME